MHVPVNYSYHFNSQREITQIILPINESLLNFLLYPVLQIFSNETFENGLFFNIFNVYQNQLSRQAGSRNLTGPKTLPTIWHTYMKLVTKYQIPVINSCLEKCDEIWAYKNACSMCIKTN